MTWVSEALDALDRAELQMQYGEGKWPCALCGQVRPMADLARWNYRDDFFVMCNAIDDPQPTCYDRYRSGRREWMNAHPETRQNQ